MSPGCSRANRLHELSVGDISLVHDLVVRSLFPVIPGLLKSGKSCRCKDSHLWGPRCVPRLLGLAYDSAVFVSSFSSGPILLSVVVDPWYCLA